MFAQAGAGARLLCSTGSVQGMLMSGCRKGRALLAPLGGDLQAAARPPTQRCPIHPGCLGAGGSSQQCHLHSLVSSDRSWESPSLLVSWTGERISLTKAKDTG